MTFVRIIPGDDALTNGLIYPNNAGLRLATNGSTSGLSAAGSYCEMGLAFWMDSAQTRCTLLDLGCIWIGFDANMNAAGPSIGVAVTDGGGNHYSARYAVDPRSSTRTVRHLEVEYAEGFGYTVFYNGVALTAVATGGTDSGIETYTSSIGLGCDVQGNNALTRGSSVLGSSYESASTSDETSNELHGGIVWAAIGRDPGIWTLHMDMEGDFVDDSNGTTLVPRWQPVAIDYAFVDPTIPTGTAILYYRRQQNVPTITSKGPWTEEDPLIIDSGRLGLVQLKYITNLLSEQLNQTIRVKDISPTRFGLTKKVQRRLNYP